MSELEYSLATALTALAAAGIAWFGYALLHVLG